MKYKFLTAVLAILAVFSGCDTDFEVNAEWKDISIVY